MEDLLSDLSNPWVMLTFYRKLFPFKLLQSYLNKSHCKRPLLARLVRRLTRSDSANA